MICVSFQNLQPVICKVANFIGKSVTEGDIEKLLHHLSFSSMKRNAAVNYESYIQNEMKKNSTESSDGHFMRRGIVGDWKTTFDVELLNKFEKWEKENCNGIDFTYSV